MDHGVAPGTFLSLLLSETPVESLDFGLPPPGSLDYLQAAAQAPQVAQPPPAAAPPAAKRLAAAAAGGAAGEAAKKRRAENYTPEECDLLVKLRCCPEMEARVANTTVRRCGWRAGRCALKPWR